MAKEKIEVQVVVDESAAVKGIAALDRSLDNMAVSLAMLEGSVDKMNGKLDSLGTTSQGSTASAIQGLSSDFGALLSSTGTLADAFANSTSAVEAAGKGLSSILGPVSAVFSGFSALVSIGSEVMDWFGRMEEKYRGESELLKETRAQIEESIAGMDSLAASRQRNVENGMAEIAMTEMLYGKLADMADANGVISAADAEHAQVLADQLIPALGETVRLNEDGSMTLLKSADDVKTYLEQKKAQMMVEAMEPEIKYAMIESAKLYNAMMENSAQIAANNEKIKANSIAHDKAMAEGNMELANSLSMANLKLQKDNEARQASNDEMLASYETYTGKISEYDANMTALMLGDTEAILEGQATQLYAQEEGNAKVKELYGQRITDAQDCLDTLHEIHEKGAVDLGDAIYTAAEERVDSVNQAYLELGTSAANGLNTGIDEAEPTVTENAAQMVAGAKGAADAQAGGFKSTGSEAGGSFKQGMAEKNPEVVEEARLGFEAAALKAGESVNKYKEAGTGAVEGFKGSMAEQREQLEAYVENYFAGMGDSAKKGIQVNSPSKVFQKIGLAVGEGFRLGMEQDKPKAERTVLDYFQKMIATVKAETRKLNLEFALAQGLSGAGGTGRAETPGSVTQTIHFNQPVQTPAQMARALRKESQKLARGVC